MLTHSYRCFAARVEFNENVGKQSASVLTFDGFGSDFIKKTNNPPDAFVQVAMQLATYRLFGEQVGTYESTQVRPFRHGRTEVTVSLHATGCCEFQHEEQKTTNLLFRN